MVNDAHILILAAGLSARMRGADKLLEPVFSQPLLAHVAKVALATGTPVTVALPAGSPDRQAALAGLPVTITTVPMADLGISASLRAGLAILPASAPVMVLLADMPDLTTDDLRLLLQAWGETPDLILRGAAEDGTPGHPVCLPGWTRAGLDAISGDTGARALLARHASAVRHVILQGHHAITDLDTPEDWDRWRAAIPKGPTSAD